MLRYIIIFPVLLMTAVNVQAQCERPAGENMILIDESGQQTFPDGSSARFRCSTGYIPVRISASRSITCTGTQWSDLALQCKKRSCGHPGEIPNGKYLFPEGILFGATITAQCNEGYRPIGSQATRNCRESGWDGRTPICEAVKCGKPPSIRGGVFEPDNEAYDYGEGVTYYCDGGLDLIGPSEISCSGDGTFQPPPPQCRLVTCERPAIPNSFRIGGKAPPYKYNNFVRYRCDKGYRMEGSDFLTCKENGWDPPPPQCNVVTCLKPPDISNGIFYPLRDLYTYSQTVIYRCNEGFRLRGASRTACTEYGTFQTFPQCQEITCSSIRNAVISGSSSPYKYGVSVQIRCNKGYRLIGSGNLTCGELGWNPRSLHCAEVTCKAPSINNAFIVGRRSSSYSYSMSIQYKCNRGYRMEGSGRLTCEENGWNPLPPKCNIVTCLKPPVINNGQFNPLKDLYEYGETVTYSCQTGFTLDGDSTISCTDGNFQHAPQCQEISCGEPQIENGFIFEDNSTSYGYKSSVRVQCNPGYKMEGSDYLTCEENGWSPSPPLCTFKNFCESPGKILNGQYLFPEGTEFGATITARCNEGYQLVGRQNRICRETGWDGNVPLCKELKCQKPPSITNGTFEPEEESYDYGEAVIYSCNRDHYLIGPSVITCSSNGTFQPPPPRCLPFTENSCGSPGKILNGKYLIPEGILLGATITAQCNEGYQLVGHQNRICRETGWDGNAPVCEVVNCQKPSNITNGMFEPEEESYDYGEAVIYSCNRDYSLIGPSVITCSNDGTFQPPPPRCLQVTCDGPQIEHGFINKAQYERPFIGGNWVLTHESGSTITFRCSAGYRPLSSSNFNSIICNGKQRTGLSLQCEKKSCGSLVDLQNGKYLTPGGILFGATATAQCNKGYVVVGPETRNCRDDGWDGRPAVCEVVKCQPPPSIQNGQFEPMEDSYSYGEAVEYSCSEDYTLVGESTVTCSENGTFYPSPPQCLVMHLKCDAPKINNAVRIEGRAPPYTYKQFVWYKCNEGYKMEGSDYLTCDVNGWNPPPPVCIEKSCGSLVDLQNGKYLTPDGILFGATATAQCNKGYVVVGPETRNCRDDGWDGRPAVCEVVKCQPPPSIQNGQFEPMEDSYSYGEAVEYSCSEDYTLVGESTVTCSENGTFYPSPPQCLVMHLKCDAPKINNAVRIEGRAPPYTYKQFVRYKCNEGYKMEGSDYLTCDVNGWNPPPPVCIVIKCDAPEINNAVRISYSTPPYTYKQLVWYNCNEGYIIEGRNFLICDINGWNHPPPVCIERTSERETQREKREEKTAPQESTEEGSQDAVEQEQCFEALLQTQQEAHQVFWNLLALVGPQAAVSAGFPHVTLKTMGPCNDPEAFLVLFEQVVEVWEWPVEQTTPLLILVLVEKEKMCDRPWYRLIIFLICLMKVAEIKAQCERPDVGENRVIVDDSGQETFPNGSTVTFKCSVGYRPESSLASKSITCVGTEWTNLELNCTKKSCGLLPELANGKYTYPNGHLFGATAEAQCNEGYMLVGQNTRNCLENGWDGRDHVCEAVKCEPPPTILNGEFEPLEPSYNYNQAVIYSCSGDFTLIGESTITCSDNGTFHPSPPQCKLIVCDTPNIKNAVRVEGKPPPYGYKNFVRYQCIEGYTMTGSDYLVCDVNGWNPPPPECISQCKRPDVGENRVIVDDSGQETFPNGSTVTFKCSVGYRPVNSLASKNITCVGTEWTQLELNCTKKSCGLLPELSNGKYTYPNGHLFGATAEAQCNEGYRLVGQKTRNCRDSGWDGRDPVCEVVKCEPPPAISNGEFVPVDTSYNYNQAVVYSCSGDYTLIGESTITCSDNGTFHPSPPQCKLVVCDTPNITNAVRVEGKPPPYGYKNFVRYQCIKGYTMTGSDYLVCDVNGWNPPPPECILNKIPSTTSPPSDGNCVKPSAIMLAVVSIVVLLGPKDSF
ncbi:sushi, von Willebrand factor type A, EGF and pentraxin domain-containing protein 1-like [Neoarius graeffei]|uniref:sushi, von Willebrand factor type A, EGF and pentraxin domain-containing protein 1-like n=1 Tax=Neoarius graeffei TaxID=443677 RepID=UPI00298C698E|nr:sushi, von Willebrand factor type A, EGF and pentraxin domain-containing protein 1-like [Neoarius graeffei]